MDSLQVFYKDKEKVNPEFDTEIEKLAKKFGLSITGSGFALKEKIRDLYFAKKKKTK